MSPPNPRPSPEVVRAKQREIARRYARRNRGRFDHNACNAVRRREIERYIVANAENLSRCLIAWVWHLPPSANPLQAVLNCASRLGLKITPADASRILEEASITRPHMNADNLGRFLGLTYAVRNALRITTIGAKDVGKRARKELRKRRDRLAKQTKRRASGVPARDEYEANSIAAKARAEGVSRMTIYRRRKRAEQATNMSHVTSVSAAFFLTYGEDGPVTPTGVQGPSERGFASKKARGLPSSQTATTIAREGANV